MKDQKKCFNCGAPLAKGVRQRFCPKCLYLQATVGVVSLASIPITDDQGPEQANQKSAWEAENQQWTEAPLFNQGGQPLSRFGDYELLEEIGRGGMGVVYRARQRSLDRVVAIKMLTFGPGASQELIERFRAEAVAAGSLHHPNIVAIHEVGRHEGLDFYVMDYVEGQSLARLVGNQPLPARRAAGYLRTIAEAVHYAHERGILHRDLKPSNILIDSQDQPHVVDFGLARRLQGLSELTVTGQVLGSPHYLPPEQASGQRAHISRRTDIYALGATLYHLLTGRPPFQAESLTQTLDLVLHAEPVAPHLLNPGIPRDLETICLKCLEKEPLRRYATARELGEELVRFEAGEPIRARPLSATAKTWRWCQRNPALASAITAVALSLLVGVMGVTWQLRRTEEEALLNRRYAYAADMWDVQRAIAASDLGRARELLYQHVPESESQVDLRSWEWRYLWSRCQGNEKFRVCDDSDAVTGIALSPGGKWLAVRRAGTVALWDWTTKEMLWGWPAPGGGPRLKVLAFSPQNELLAWSSQDQYGSNIVALARAAQQGIFASLAHPAAVRSLSFSPDGLHLATMADDGYVRVWDVHLQQILNSVPAYSHDLYRSGTISHGFVANSTWSDHYGCVAFSPDGHWLAISAMGGRVRILDRVSGRERDELQVSAAGEDISALAFSPDGRILALGCGVGDTHVHLLELESNTSAELVGHSGWIAGLAFSPDGRLLASVSSDQTVRIWDVASRTTRPLQGHTDEVWALAWSSDGRSLATGSKDGSVRCWDPAALPSQPFVELPANVRPRGLAFLPDSKRLLTLTLPEGAVLMWDTRTLQQVDDLSVLGKDYRTLDLSPDGHWLSLGDRAGNIWIWDFRSRQLVTNLFLAGLDTIFFSPRGRLLAGANLTVAGMTAKVWSIPRGEEVDVRRVQLDDCLHGLFTPDEKYAVMGYKNGTALVWEFSTQRQVQSFVSASQGPVWLALSADGRLLAAGGSDDGLLTVWDTRTKKPSQFGRVSRNGVQHVLFSPDSQRIVAGGGLGPGAGVKLWDTVTGREVVGLPGTFRLTNQILFSPDGNTLLLGSIERMQDGGEVVEGKALLWRAPSLAEIEYEEGRRATAK